MQKLFLGKQSTAADAVEQVLRAEDAEVTLVVPKGAAIAGDADNFSLVKREAQAAGKTVMVESVDETALEAARRSGLETVHPLFQVNNTRMLSDIVPAAARHDDSPPARSGKKKAPPRGSKKSAKKISISVEIPKEEEASPIAIHEPEQVPASAPLETPAAFHDEARPPRSRRGLRIVAGLIVIIFIAGWTVGKVWGKAVVNLEFKKQDWNYQGDISVSKAAANINADSKTLPGELFVETKNLTSLFPASGRREVSEKARGKIIIYNAYSSDAQPLVATTRFMAPDGKVFRLSTAVTVPGAHIKNGVIEPSSVAADVVADQPGADYNVGNIAKLTIPGFKGTPKYDAFYGAITTPLAGGLVGEKAVPTEQDIAAAKDRTRELMVAALRSGVLRGQPSDFVFVEGASETAVTKVSVVSSTEESGKFAVFAEGEIRAVGFREKDLNALFASLAAADPAKQLTLKDIAVSYSNPKPDFTNGTLKVAATAKGIVTGAWSADDFKTAISGASVEEAKRIILAIPELSHGKISLQPLWITKVPAKSSRIFIESNY